MRSFVTPPKVPLMLLLLILFSTSVSVAQGQRQKAEDWAWDQIRTGNVADFNARCGQLDPKKSQGWADACRDISGSFIQVVLTDPKRQADVQDHKVWFRGAHVID